MVMVDRKVASWMLLFTTSLPPHAIQPATSTVVNHGTKYLEFTVKATYATLALL